MNMLNPDSLSLPELSTCAAVAAQQERDACRRLLRDAILQRLNDGRRAEVLAFCRDCPLEDIGWMGQRWQEAAWHADADLWLDLLAVLLPRGILPAQRDWPAGSEAAHSRRLGALLDNFMARCRQMGPLTAGQVSLLGALSGLLATQYATREQVLARLDWLLELRREAGMSSQRGADDWSHLLQALADEDLLALRGRDPRLTESILQQWLHRYRHDSSASLHWRPWREYLTANPQMIDSVWPWDSWMVGVRWLSAGSQQRGPLAVHFLSLLNDCQPADRAEAYAQFEQMLADEPQIFIEQLSAEWSPLNLRLAGLIEQRQYPQLLPLLLPAIANALAHDYAEGRRARQYRGMIRRLLASRAEDVRQLSAKQLAALLPHFDRASLLGSLPMLSEITAGSSAKTLRAAWAALAGELPLDCIEQAGWLNKPKKNLLLTCIEVLLAHPDPAAGALLQQLAENNKLDVSIGSRIDGHLQQLGLREAVAAEKLDLADLEQQAASQKRFAASIRHFDCPDLLALMQPLSEHAARTLLHLAATSEDEMPPLAAQLLAQIPAVRRGRLARQLAEIWIANEGEPRQRWALRLLEGNADDQLVDLLADTVVAWHSKRKPRAAALVGYLARVDSPYALMRVQQIVDNRRIKEQVVSEARKAMQAAARRRGLMVLELQDELTPDFGLAEGIVLTVGEQQYRIELQGDLSLRVIDDQGKPRKSIPRPKDAELLERWEDAAGQLKTLSAALKKVIQQQGPRMQGALMTGQCWALARWQRLFLQHPLLRVVGRSLIWCDQSGQSFRIAEDFSLVNVEDDPVELAEGSQIHLWHPVSAAAGEREVWQDYFADYELEPMVDQLGAPASLPAAEQLDGSVLAAQKGLKVEQMRLSGLLRKFGYRSGPVGDGPSIECHLWPLDALELVVELNHGWMPPWREEGNQVEIEGLRVHRMVQDDQHDGASVVLSSLPLALQATLQHQLGTLQQYSEVTSI